MNPLWQAMLGSKKVLLTGPVKPDGDSIGACLALSEALRQHGVTTHLAGEVVNRYAWMPGAGDFVDDEAVTSEAYDCVVILDGDKDRLLPGAAKAFKKAALTCIIDHHASTQPQGYVHSWLDPKAASTCEMLFDLFESNSIGFTESIAINLYTGFVFDTGSFRYSNTSSRTHRMAGKLLDVGIDHAKITAKVLLERSHTGLRAAGRVYSNCSFEAGGAICIGRISLETADELQLEAPDLEGIVDMLVFTTGVEIAALAIQRDEHSVKFSLRSRDKANVCAIAQRLSPTGGGHRKAAGATIHSTLNDSVDTFLAEALEELKRMP
jgi:bifunctional oligoribonuclease and PAP phosphatase NrnA